MNRQQANAEIARRLGWTVEQDKTGLYFLRGPAGYPDGKSKSSEQRAWETAPDYFSCEKAARELVQWFAALSYLSRDFTLALREILFADSKAKQSSHVEFLFWHLLATPEQKATAACKAWGIELEEETK